jgi:hypothetical protein
MTDARRGFSVRIFVPSGDPDGVKIVEKSNWTGQGVVFPRSLFTEARARPEMQRTGIYLLWGPSESGQLPRAYVGEGDPVLPRLEQHARNKDFWTHSVVFTSKDQNLNKAYVQHIEARLVGLARAANRCELDNGNVPKPPTLSEADAADAETFLADILLCLPVVGVSLFETTDVAEVKGHDLILRAKGIEGRGLDAPQGFVVRVGSTAVKAEVPSIHGYLVDLRHTLIEKGILTDSGEVYRLAQDYTFASPSTAAGVLLGRSANGRVEWKDNAGRTLKELQAQLPASAG